jgi:Ni/Fe-hydrogenase subunit HybB-like protein
MKLQITKMILWLLAGFGFTIVVLRILHGPGSVTALTDLIPWGMWKGWGVVALVPIGGAGFTLAMLVYVFGLSRYRPVVRGAVLLGLICYSSVAVGLTMDIGIWWRIVFPVFHWQFHSVLFEIAWCIMLYLLVLMVEFSHTVVHRFQWTRAIGALDRISIVLVIFGICLSTLHQSSLGTLFLATPFRLHPLWHTDFLPLLFFVSSMALGCLTISFLTIIVYWLYGGEAPMRAISGLGRISAYLMVVYVAVKFVDILASGEGTLLLTGNWDTANFWIEVVLGSLIPMVFLLRNKYRRSRTAMFWISLCAVIGMSLNRVNVAGLATLSLTKTVYFPAWTELAMTAGIIAGALLFFLFCVECFGLYEGLRRERVPEWIEPARFDHSDWKTLYFGAQRLGSVQLYSFVFVLAAAVSFGMASNDAVFGVSPRVTPSNKPRWVEILKTGERTGGDVVFAVVGESGNPHPKAPNATVMLLDSNRDGRYVLFDHKAHESRNQGEKSCAVCHHMNKPLSRRTGCYECHSDMYLDVDIFDHDFHMATLGSNDHCSDCHVDPGLPKTRENTKLCVECHKGMVAEGSRVEHSTPVMDSRTLGYMDAVHGLCIACHQEEQKTMEIPNENLSRCTYCHQSLPDLTDRVWDLQR